MPPLSSQEQRHWNRPPDWGWFASPEAQVGQAGSLAVPGKGPVSLAQWLCTIDAQTHMLATSTNITAYIYLPYRTYRTHIL